MTNKPYSSPIILPYELLSNHHLNLTPQINLQTPKPKLPAPLTCTLFITVSISVWSKHKMRQKCTTKMYSEIMIWPQTIIYHSYISYLHMYFQNMKPWSKTPSKQHICILLAAVPTKSIKLLGSLHASSHEILTPLTFFFAWTTRIRTRIRSWVLSYQGKYVHQENCHKANRHMGRYRSNQERPKYIDGDTSTQSISHHLPYPIGFRL